MTKFVESYYEEKDFEHKNSGYYNTILGWYINTANCAVSSYSPDNEEYYWSSIMQPEHTQIIRDILLGELWEIYHEIHGKITGH
jgi:hypothetical protein